MTSIRRCSRMGSAASFGRPMSLEIGRALNVEKPKLMRQDK